MPPLHHLGQVIGHQLETLHLEQEKSGHFHVHDHHFRPPTLLLSLFPNFQSVAWLSITLGLNDQVSVHVSLKLKTSDLLL